MAGLPLQRDNEAGINLKRRWTVDTGSVHCDLHCDLRVGDRQDFHLTLRHSVTVF